MSRHNYCFVVGNIGMEPTERGRGGKGGAIVVFTVAENVQTYDTETRSYKNLHTNWFNVTAFGNIAERAKSGLKKGDRVAIQGKMKISRYTDRGGQEKNGFEIIADEIALWKNLSADGGRTSDDETGADGEMPF